MTDDVMKRVRQTLKMAPSRQMLPAGPLLDRGNDLLARSRALIETTPKVLTAARPVRPPGPELVRLPMICSARGGSYVVIAERQGNKLRFVRHEMPKTRREGEYRPGLLSGEYEIELQKGWACPLCRNDSFWVCQCPDFAAALHCRGASGGRYHCACGRFEERSFTVAKKFEVCGGSVGVTPDTTRSQHGQPQLKQVSYDRNR